MSGIVAEAPIPPSEQNPFGQDLPGEQHLPPERSTRLTADPEQNPFGKDNPGAGESPVTDGGRTTWGGMAASAARGLAPYAAGAGIGAGIGAAGGPVGAVGGASLVLGAQAAAEIYNLIGPRLGLPKSATPQEIT